MNLSKKIGLPPGSPVYVGESMSHEVNISILDYSLRHLDEIPETGPGGFASFLKRDSVTWIRVSGIHQPEIIKEIGCVLDIHPLIVEDILHPLQRPKFEGYPDCLFFVLRIIDADKETGELRSEQLGILTGSKYVVTFTQSGNDVFHAVTGRIKKGGQRIRGAGADYLTYALIDNVVDLYMETTESLEDRIEFLEDDLFTEPSENFLKDIYSLKQDVIYFRKQIVPILLLLEGLEKSQSELFREPTKVFLRDLKDHVLRTADSVESFRDTVTALLGIYHSAVSNKMNEVMKLLTIIATIFIPMTFIAGIYGMNFKYMPELEWRWGYGMIWFVCILVALCMILYFKRKKWL